MGSACGPVIEMHVLSNPMNVLDDGSLVLLLVHFSEWRPRGGSFYADRALFDVAIALQASTLPGYAAELVVAQHNVAVPPAQTIWLCEMKEHVKHTCSCETPEDALFCMLTSAGMCICWHVLACTDMC